ncbi:tetratricopeptide repeat protein [Poseidonocella sp. HB161398]|uniref:tetratricopeptide repeat protein n=1 Tax=Poseidonocella sp. HB161398 TaxID=2320855 RepID=UPI001486E2ED|nr:tetratricopeptide repeat protein [Poseidonocella sp. HB161398]
MRHFTIPLLLFLAAAPGARAAQTETGPSCPPPMEFAERKADLLAELQETRSRADGLYLTRHLVGIFATAPNREAQKLLDKGISLRQAHAAAAGETLDALIAYCPDFAEGYHQRALLHQEDGDLDAALADLDRALAQAPDHVAALARRVQVLSALGRAEEATEAGDRLSGLNPWMPVEMLEPETPGTLL